MYAVIAVLLHLITSRLHPLNNTKIVYRIFEKEAIAMFKKILSAILLTTMLVPAFASCKGKDEPKEKIGPVFDVLTDEAIEVFSNPVSIEEPLPGSIGDPFVMRYDGMYYLYPSNSCYDPFIRCWSSKDLVNWKNEGIIANDKGLAGAYAPEVTYFNGKFYMYTATPEGRTHRCLVSDSPTGPFKMVDGNQDCSIDGHVFIDNDGKWYFYSAAAKGVQCYEMQSPEWIGNPSKGTMAQITNAWTEGPMVVYHDGYYYFTYTGNRVWNTAYRICYSVSKNSPYTYKQMNNNIILVSTVGEMISAGHSSTVKAPDLDGYYIAYHTLLSSDAAAQRRVHRYMAIDRIIFDGENMSVMGPTAADQPISSMPDIYSHFDEDDSNIFEKLDAKIVDGKLVVDGGKKLVSKNSLAGSKYTIEITASDIAKDAKAGVIFGYKDEKNYGKAVLDTKTEKLVVTFVVDGKETKKETALVRSFDIPYDFDALQSIQVEKSGKTFTFYVNDRELCKFDSELDGNKVGLITEGGKASFGFIGATDEVSGSSNCDFYKPVSFQSGTIPAHLAREDDKLSVGADSDGSKFVNVKAGDSLNYRIYAADGGNHSFGIKYKSEKDVKVEIYLDGKLFTEMTLAASDKYTTEAVTGLTAEKGKHVVTLYVKEGGAVFKSIEMIRVSDSGTLSLDFERENKNELVYTDGLGWSVSGGKLKGTSIGKRTYGNVRYGNYIYEGEITFDGRTVSGGLLFRTSNAAHTGIFNSSKPDPGYTSEPTEETTLEGETWMQGYYIHFTAREILLKKYDFNMKQLKKFDYKTEAGKTYKFKLACDGANFKLYMNDELVIDYTDADPYLSGAVGMKVTNGSVVYDNIKVTVKEKN